MDDAEPDDAHELPAGSSDHRLAARPMTRAAVQLRDQATGSGSVCTAILRELPHWFGFEQANADYAMVADRSPTVIASVDGEDVGFLTLVHHSAHAAEIHVMGVLPAHHRRGIGRLLVAHAEGSLANAGVEFLQVKTVSASAHDEGYARTLAFYLAEGFRVLEEMPDLWSADNPAVQLVKAIPPPAH